ncbi:MAG: tol-pal system YbgF family protein [Acidobacteriota bacterium]
MLLPPFLVFAAGVFLYFETEHEVRAQFDRARQEWRTGHYREAARLYDSVYRHYPASGYGARALWELGTIHYVNWYQIDRALEDFQRLIEEYPGSPLVTPAYLRLAEIHAIGFQDLPQAIRYWKVLLTRRLPQDLRHQVLFKTGTALFKLGHFEEARQTLEQLVARRPEDHLAQEARLRIGTILQLGRQYRQSLNFFLPVLHNTTCSECRLQAQLGLIEDYEFLNDLPRAIEYAKAIHNKDYPFEMKQELLARLQKKRRYYEPRLWKGRKR